MGLTFSAPLKIHLTVTGLLYSTFMSFGHLVSQSILVLWPLLCLRLSLIRLLFWTGIYFSRPFWFRAHSYQLNPTGSLLLQVLSFDISGVLILVSVFWVHI